MSMLAERTSIISKTKELCESIATDEKFIKLQADVERFLNDDVAKLQYQTVHEKGEELHHKQHAGVELGAAEIKSFEDARDALFENKTASDFMDAQRTLETMQKQIGKYVSMTLELGRVPSDEEIAEAENSGGGCCGGGGGGGGCCS
ncbi:MAG: YlbF family regulator [Luteolibacter sp.]